jgi:hypothetical protein
MDDVLIKTKVKCCSCFKPLINCKHVNCMLLDYEAPWLPAWGNVLYGVPVKGAIAVVCDECLKKKHDPTHAVEWSDSKLTRVTYHPLSELKKFAVPSEVNG